MNGLFVWFRQTHVLQRTAILLALVMLAHGFDSCSAHAAGMGQTMKTAPSSLVQVTSARSAPLDTCGQPGNPPCERCRAHEPQTDICEVTSETVTLPLSAGLELAPPVLFGLPLVFTIPDIIDLMPVSLAPQARDESDVLALTSTQCRGPLAGRAPPISA